MPQKRTTDIPLPNDTGEIDPRLLGRMVSGSQAPQPGIVAGEPQMPDDSILGKLLAFLQGQPIKQLAKRTPQIP